MRLTLVLLGLVLMGEVALAQPPAYLKARVFSVNIGSVIPIPQDSGEAKPDEHEREDRDRESTADEHAVFVVLRAEKGMVVGKFRCDDHCLTLKDKIMHSRDVEYRELETKLWMKVKDETLEGIRIRGK